MTVSRSPVCAVAALALVTATLPVGARADDLPGALAAAWRNNPDLQAARDSQRGIDENVPIARAAALPSLSGTATYVRTFGSGSSSSFGGSAPSTLTYGPTLSLPIYAGGAIRNGIHAAETRVRAGQDSLAGTESGVLTQAVTAYMDVIRSVALVGLQKNNVQVLEVNLQATSDRFQIGDLTRTDVAQSRSRLALARASLRTAEADLVGSRETYVKVIGRAPGDLAAPPPLAGLPKSVEDAVGYALEHNPDLLAARERAKAAQYDVRSAAAARLPKLSLQLQNSTTNFLGTFSPPGIVPNSSNSTTASVSASIPFYQGGAPAAQIRQAQDAEGAALDSEIGTERTVIAAVRTAWSSWVAAREVIALNQTAVDAAALSLEGVRAENTVGNRTVLNILDAEQELVNARSGLVTAERNAYVAGFNLLAAMGKARARDLGLDGGTLYDPETHYEAVRHQIWDWHDEPAPHANATSTIDTPAQDAKIPDQPLP